MCVHLRTDSTLWRYIENLYQTHLDGKPRPSILRPAHCLDGLCGKSKITLNFPARLPIEKHFLMIIPTPQSFSKEQSQLSWQKGSMCVGQPFHPTTA